MKRETGKLAEQKAEYYLKSKGLNAITQNFLCKLGEIDLIMSELNTLVFVEVKYRKSTLFGGAISAVSAQKIDKIKRSALIYMQQQSINAYNTACRFDVVALSGDVNHPKIEWIKNAF
ncbi:YraN family protein [Thalassotalea agarivorans]|uniref:UPF0102 protein SAMN05660429_00058 n=1 Tax=Thalassotalea agarivorans TaxID=349064 RepID=A0A1H9Y4Y4_THASX|nr:YraN family protein [Thalassotalea agarivorans]SES63433.1 putative endonuclease [Thalassotalea agarivorans]